MSQRGTGRLPHRYSARRLHRRAAAAFAALAVLASGGPLARGTVSASLKESTNNPNWDASGIWFIANPDGTPSSTATTTPPAGSIVYAGYQPASPTDTSLNYDVLTANSVLLNTFNLNSSSATEFTLTQNTAGTLLQATTENIGNTTAGADYELLDGTNTVTTLNIGNGSTGQGIYHVGFGNTALNASAINIGANGSTADGGSQLDQDGGTVTVSGNLDIASASGSFGSFNLSGGTLYTQSETLGDAGQCLFTQVGGLNSVTANVILANQSGSSSVYALRGGSMSVSGNITLDSASTFNLSGGTLAVFGTMTVKPGGLLHQTSGVLLLSGGTSSSNNGTFFAGGTFVDTGGFTNAGTATFASIQDWTVGVAFVNTAGTASFLTDAGSPTSYALNIDITAGSVSFGSTQHLASLLVFSGAIAVATPVTPHTNRSLLVIDSLNIIGNTDAWVGKLDLTTNDMDVVGGSLSTITNQIKSGYNGGAWNGLGITSSSAASDTTHLTALGAIQNNDGFGHPIYGSGTTMGLFDGANPSIFDVLVKYTYYGDTNLDGQVDGSDYSRIDNGFNNHLTGWANGDFNYDGVVDGSDYTLIDNAFNTQAGNLSSTALIAASAGKIGTSSAIPEPTTLAILSLALVAALRPRYAGSRRVTTRGQKNG